MTKLFEAKPFIIAEVGSNWTSFQEAKDSISFAKQAGADAVKFQLFSSVDLYGYPIPWDGPIDPATQLNREWLPKLKEKADACGIEFMCSAFSPELVDVVDPFVSVHKVASSEMAYPQLLERVKSKGKPILLSVGASSKGDIELALKILLGAPQRVLMYCSSAYPSRYFNLFQMNDLKETFDLPVGFSDHSDQVAYSALSAVHHFGAVAIEKHVNFHNVKSPDSEHSLSYQEFAYMCELLHGKRDYKQFNPQPDERDMFMKHNRRLIAIQNISVGDTFRFGKNYGAFRSLTEDAKGLIPHAWVAVEDKVAMRKIEAGDSIGPGDFE